MGGIPRKQRDHAELKDGMEKLVPGYRERKTFE